MTAEQLKARVPGIKVVQGEFGTSQAALSSVNFRDLDAVAYKGVNEITFSFLDDRLVRLTVYYQAVPWRNVDQFAAKVSESLKLPDAWRGNQNSKELPCTGFNVWVTTYTNSVILDVPGHDEILKQRREQHAEQLRQSFRP
jgi:hypothetical protein